MRLYFLEFTNCCGGDKKFDKMSMGTGKMIVELCSAEMLFKV